VFRLPIPDRIQKLKDPEVRRWMVERAASPEAGMLRQYADFGRYRIGEVFSDDNAPYVGRVVSEIAVEQGRDAFSVIVDIATRDMLRTVLWPIAVDDTAEYWEQRRLMWEDDRVLIGGSDGGAHVDRMLGSSYTTRFLADVLRGRKLVSLERAVQLLTDAPARLYGLKGRGRLDVGAPADLVLFDPDRVDAGMPRFAHEFPASSAHLTADSYGIERVLVNGVQVVVGGHVTGACPGEVLRSGRDSTSSAPN
jgi:N-acyl-D-aspartate/D-glutamate deacylase